MSSPHPGKEARKAFDYAPPTAQGRRVVGCRPMLVALVRSPLDLGGLFGELAKIDVVLKCLRKSWCPSLEVKLVDSGTVRRFARFWQSDYRAF